MQGSSVFMEVGKCCSVKIKSSLLLLDPFLWPLPTDQLLLITQKWWRRKEKKKRDKKTGVISDPLGQPHRHAYCKHYFTWRFVQFYWFFEWEWTYRHGICMKIIITTGIDRGSAVWIKKRWLFSMPPERATQKIHTLLLPPFMLHNSY